MTRSPRSLTTRRSYSLRSCAPSRPFSKYALTPLSTVRRLRAGGGRRGRGRLGSLDLAQFWRRQPVPPGGGCASTRTSTARKKFREPHRKRRASEHLVDACGFGRINRGDVDVRNEPDDGNRGEGAVALDRRQSVDRIRSGVVEIEDDQGRRLRL